MKKRIFFTAMLLFACTIVSLAIAQQPPPPPPPPNMAPPPPSPPQHNVCFYSQPHFQGAVVCAVPGINTPDASHVMVNGRFQNWDKQIQSIRLIGNAKVTVYNGKNYTGTLLKLTESQPDLHRVRTTQGYYNWANQISSYMTTW